MITEASTCPKCGAPIFEVEGRSVSACTCGKITQPPPSTNPFNQPNNALDIYELVKEIVSGECTDGNGNVTSNGKYYYAKALKLLHSKGEIVIKQSKGPFINGVWR